MSSGFQNFGLPDDPAQLLAIIKRALLEVGQEADRLNFLPIRFLADRLTEADQTIESQLTSVAQHITNGLAEAGQTIDQTLNNGVVQLMGRMEAPVQTVLAAEDSLHRASLQTQDELIREQCRTNPNFRLMFPELCLGLMPPGGQLPAPPVAGPGFPQPPPAGGGPPPGGSIGQPIVPPSLTPPSVGPPQQPAPPLVPPAPGFPPGVPPGTPGLPPGEPPGAGPPISQPPPIGPGEPPEGPGLPVGPIIGQPIVPIPPGFNPPPIVPPPFVPPPLNPPQPPIGPPVFVPPELIEPPLPPQLPPAPPGQLPPCPTVIDADSPVVSIPGVTCSPPSAPPTCPQCGCVTCQCGPREPEEPGGRWVVWQNPATRLCYVARSIDPPRTYGDVAIGRGDTVADAVQAAGSECPPTQTQPPQPGGGGGRVVVDARTGCELDEYATGEGSQAAPQATSFQAAFQTFLAGSPENWQQWVRQWQTDRDSVNPVTAITARVSGSFWTGIDEALQVLDRLATGSGAVSGESTGSLIGLLLGDWIGLISPTLRTQLLTGAQYTVQSAHPVLFPTAAQAAGAFIGGEITPELAQVWSEQNNQCWAPWRRVIDSQRRRMEPLTAMEMLLRGIINQDQFEAEFKRMGWRMDSDNGFVSADRFKQLARFIPPISDLVRFLVRDVEDERIVRDFGLDAEFGDKWRGLLARFGEQQGIDTETARRYWRAHWSIPSPTQLFEMFHRSRARQFRGPNVTTREQIEAALRQQDILPFWIPRLIDTTFSRLSRVDVRRAFNLGAINEDEMRAEFTKIGYDDVGVAALVAFAKRDRIESARNVKEVQLYRKMLISRDEAVNRLRARNLPMESIEEILRDAQLEGSDSLRDRCTTSIRDRYLLGEIDREEARQQLLMIHPAPEFVPGILASFDCERAAQGKHPSTSQLCQWLDEGTIGPDEFLQRLKRVGWSDADASRILTGCLSKIEAGRRRIAERLAREEAAAVRQREQAAERERRRVQRQQETTDRALGKARRAKDRREKLLQSAVAKWGAAIGTSVADLGPIVDDLYRAIGRDYLITADEVVQTIVLSIERGKPESPDELRRIAGELAERLETSQDLPPDVLVSESLGVTG